MTRPILSFENSRERAFCGAIVTFVNKDNGKLRVVHRAGYSFQKWKGRFTKGETRETVSVGFLEVMTALMEEADRWTGNWKVVTICTPASIYADLTTTRKQGVPNYEAAVLKKIDRIDMWDGTYANSTDERRRRRAESER